MRRSFLILVLVPAFISCVHSGKKENKLNPTVRQAMDVAVKYANAKFNQPKDSTTAMGIVTVEEGMVNLITPAAYKIKYYINPLKITTGLINDDEDEDAIAYIYSVDGQGMENPEHLILITSDGKLMLSQVIEANMTVISIKDRIITAEVSSRSLNTPLRDCHVCKEVVKYRFKSGDLVKI